MFRRLICCLVFLAAASPSAAEHSPCLDRLSTGGPFAALAGELAAQIAEGHFSAEGGRQLLVQARQQGDVGAEACAYEQLGNAAFYRGDLEGAVRAFEAALNRLVEIGDLEGQAYRLKDIGICLRSQGRFAESLQAFEQARKTYPAALEGPFAVSFLGNLGSLYARLGAVRLAADAFEEALEHVHPDDSVQGGAWDLRMRLAQLVLESGARHRAVELLEDAAVDVRKHGADRDISWVLGELSWTYERVGRTADARRVLEESLAAAKRSDDPLHIVGAWTDLGDLLLRSSIYTDSENKDVHSRGGARFAQLPPGSGGGTPSGFGPAHPNRADLQAAENAYRSAVDSDATQPLVWRAYAGLAKIRRQQGRLEEALSLFETSLELSERRRQVLTSWQDRNRLARWTRPVYGALAALYIESADPERAFDVAQLGKARDLAAELAATGVAEPDPRRLALEARAAALVAEIQDESDGSKDEAGNLRELEAIQAELDEILGASRSAGSDAPASLKEVRALLPHDAALVSYLSSKDDVTVFVVRRDALVARRLSLGESELRLAVEMYLEQLVGSRHWTAASRRLYRELIHPVADALEGVERLVVASDGPLRSLPFSTLVVSGDGSKLEDFALSRWTLSLVPSARVLADLSARRSTEGADLLAVADPQVDHGFPLHRRQAELYGFEGMDLLPASREEAELAASFAHSATVLVGDQATEARLRSENLDSFRVLHVAVHALVDSKMPRRSALALTPTLEDDGFFQAREIARLTSCPELVVLAACRSGREGNLPARGSGVQGLALSFFHAGARSVLATLWSVDDAVSPAVTASFYRHLASGHDKAEALRQAQIEAFDRYGPASPRHWAPWVLIGEPFDPVPLPGRSKDRFWAWIFLMSGIVCLVLWVWQGRLQRQKPKTQGDALG